MREDDGCSPRARVRRAGGHGLYTQELCSPFGRAARVGFDVVALGGARGPLAPLIFAASNPVLGTILERPHPVADRYRRAPGVEVVRVTAANRDGVAREVAERMGTRGW